MATLTHKTHNDIFEIYVVKYDTVKHRVFWNKGHAQTFCFKVNGKLMVYERNRNE